jgi:hypothetical protein
MQAKILPATPSLAPLRILAFAASLFFVLALNCRLASIRIRTNAGRPGSEQVQFPASSQGHSLIHFFAATPA